MKKKKQANPYADFPLFLHQSGPWAKKVRGRMHYFGMDADAALKKYTEQRDDLQAGRTPRDRSGELTVRGLANCLPATRTGFLPREGFGGLTSGPLGSKATQVERAEPREPGPTLITACFDLANIQPLRGVTTL